MLLPEYERGYLPTPDGARMAYLIVGHGPVPLVLIPGAGDGLRTVYDWAEPTAWALRGRAERYCTLLISRREPIPPGFTAENHADDYIHVLEQLGWGPAILECNSGGGPIGQWIAARRPDLVRGLVLSSSLHRPCPYTQSVLRHWLDLARQRRWHELNWSSIELSFSPGLAARYRLFRPLLGLLPPPKDPIRMERLFEELIELDNSDVVSRISVPTLVIGGVDDRVIGAATQREMAELIADNRLVLYPGFGHYNDQENPDYPRQLELFVREVWPEAAANWRAGQAPDGARARRAPVLSTLARPAKFVEGAPDALRIPLAGALAGLLATVPMTLVMGALFARLSWRERNPLPPREIVTELTEKAGVKPVVGEDAQHTLTWLAHFGYGTAVGTLYAPLSRLPGHRVPGPAFLQSILPGILPGILYGLLVWAGNYLGLLPALRLLPPATEHPPRRNALMIAAHVVWGAFLGVLVHLFLDRR